MALKNPIHRRTIEYVPTLDPPKHFAKPWRSLFASPLEIFDRDDEKNSCCLSSEHSDSANGTQPVRSKLSAILTTARRARCSRLAD